MPIDFRRVTLNFSPATGHEQNLATLVTFGSRVLRADVALNGFDIRYTNGDHHILQEKVDASIGAISDRTVTARVRYLLRDSSGNIDDPFTGSVDVLVIAEVA